MTALFLTKDDVADLTGYKQVARQIAHLRNLRIPFFVDRAGRPKVARSAVEGGRAKAVEQKAEWSPSWAANQR